MSDAGEISDSFDSELDKLSQDACFNEIAITVLKGLRMPFDMLSIDMLSATLKAVYLQGEVNEMKKMGKREGWIKDE